MSRWIDCSNEITRGVSSASIVERAFIHIHLFTKNIRQEHTGRTSGSSQHLFPQVNVFKSYHRQPKDHGAPEEHVVEKGATPDPLRALDHDNRHLQHHRNEAIATELACNAAHDKFMRESADEKRDDRGHGAGHVAARRRVDVSPEEVMHWYVPLSREFKPVTAVPPVCVELAIRKTCLELEMRSNGGRCSLTGDLCKSSQDILEDDEEDE